MYLPLWLRLENSKVDSRLNICDWMYTADKTRFKPRRDCPPLQLPHLGLQAPPPDAHLRRPTEWSRLTPSTRPPSSRKLPCAAEGQVAEALLALVRRAPEGQTPGAQLCSRLYCLCPDARAIVHAHHGLKGFIEGSELLKGRVCFVADQVCGLAFAFELCGSLGAHGKSCGPHWRRMFRGR